MFTGLIEAIGTVRGLRRSGPGGRLDLDASWPDEEEPRTGDSVSVNGACLTVLEPTAAAFAVDLSPETLARTLLGSARPGDHVNLERAMRLGDRFGGHMVQGHVDGLTRLAAVEPQAGFSRWRLSLPGELAGEVAHKGSVSVHGVSLTVAGLGPDWFEVALIPETLRSTTLGRCRVGDRLHLETDVLAKYVARILGRPSSSAIDEMFGDGGGGA